MSTPDFCATQPTDRRTASGCWTTSSPTTRAMPESGRDRVFRTFTVVDLPAPFGPRSPNTVPAGTANVRPSSARTLLGYVFTNAWTSIANEREIGSVVAIAIEDMSRTGASFCNVS